MSTQSKIAYHKEERGFTLHWGKIHIAQSVYLLLGAMIIGLGGGLGAVLFRALISAASSVAASCTSLLGIYLGPYALIASAGIGGACAACIAARFAPEARGHGVPEVMAAVALRGGIMRPRIILIKALASALTIGFGGAAGREGPIVQIGCAIGSVIGQLAKAPVPVVRTLVACGAAAGISATFNAPIGGVFFASEVIMGDFAPRSFSVIVVASVVAAVIGRALLGNRPSFDASGFTLVSPMELILYAVLGVLCALWASTFVKFLYRCEDAAEAIHAPAWLKGFIGFGLVGAIGIGLPQILGVGYAAMQHVLDGHVGFQRAFLLAFMKPVATSITLAAGGSGGVFAPSLYTGAMLGDAFGRVVHGIFPLWTALPSAYGLVAMAAVFAAAAEAPITAIMIVFEMSDDYTIILPLMITTVIATILGRRFLGSTVYELKLLRRGINWSRVRHPHPLELVPISSILNESPATIDLHEPLSSIANNDRLSSPALIVTDHQRVIGTVPAAKILHAFAKSPDAMLASLVDTFSPSLSFTDSLESAVELFADKNLMILPVINTDGSLAGAITRYDLLNAYASSR